MAISSMVNLKTAGIAGAAVIAVGVGIGLVMHYEGMKTTAYKNSTEKFYTVCYGETGVTKTSSGGFVLGGGQGSVKAGDTYTAAQCKDMLQQSLKSNYAQKIINCFQKNGITNVPASMLGSLTSYAYNAGTGLVCNTNGTSDIANALKTANASGKAEDYAKVCDILSTRVTAQGLSADETAAKYPGLYTRRSAEYIQCYKDLGLEAVPKNRLADRIDKWNEAVDTVAQIADATNAAKYTYEKQGNKRIATGVLQPAKTGTQSSDNNNIVYNGTTTTTGGTTSSGTTTGGVITNNPSYSSNNNYSSTMAGLNIGAAAANMLNSGGTGQTIDLWKYNLQGELGGNVNSYGGVTSTDSTNTFQAMVSANQNFKKALKEQFGKELQEVLGEDGYKRLENVSCLANLQLGIGAAFSYPTWAEIGRIFLQNLENWVCGMADNYKQQAQQAIQNSLQHLQSELQSISPAIPSVIDGNNPIGKTMQDTINGVKFNTTTNPSNKIQQGRTDKNNDPFNKEKEQQKLQESSSGSQNNNTQLNSNNYY